MRATCGWAVERPAKAGRQAAIGERRRRSNDACRGTAGFHQPAGAPHLGVAELYKGVTLGAGRLLAPGNSDAGDATKLREEAANGLLVEPVREVADVHHTSRRRRGAGGQLRLKALGQRWAARALASGLLCGGVPSGLAALHGRRAGSHAIDSLGLGHC